MNPTLSKIESCQTPPSKNKEQENSDWNTGPPPRLSDSLWYRRVTGVGNYRSFSLCNSASRSSQTCLLSLHKRSYSSLRSMLMQYGRPSSTCSRGVLFLGSGIPLACDTFAGES